MADSVGRLVGVQPDYVFTTGFLGFRGMVRAIGGVTVNSKFSFADAVRPQGYRVGRNKLNPFQALIFGRVRHPLPNGDFDRSGNQQELLRSILRKVRAHQAAPGFMERGVLAAMKNMDTTLHARAALPARPGGHRRSTRASCRAAWSRAPPATPAPPAWSSPTSPRPAASATTPAPTAPSTTAAEAGTDRASGAERARRRGQRVRRAVVN